MAALFDVPFSPPRCPRCSSKVTDQSETHMTFLCGTELVFDTGDGDWQHDWSADANKVCSHITELREQIEQMESIEGVAAKALDNVTSLRVALAFARSVIKTGEPWTGKCDEVIDGALDSTRPVM